MGLAAVGLALAGCDTTSMPGEDESPSALSTDEAIGGALRAAAVASQDAQNYAGAVSYYNSLYQRNPEDMGAALGLARNLRFLGDVTQASRLLEEVLKRHPDDPALTAEYGKVLLARGQPREAIPVLERAAELAPDDWQVYSALGITFDLIDDSARAEDAYEQALSIRPDSASILNNLALSRAMAGDVEAGINLLRRANQQTGSNAQVRQNLALLLAVKGNLVEAERLVRADLPKEMADVNMAILERIAAKGEATTAADLAKLTMVQSVPEPEPVAVEAVAAAEPEADPAVASSTEVVDGSAESEADLAAAASAAADDAFAALLPDSSGSADASGPDVFRVQLASFTARAEAEEWRQSLARKHPDLLDGKTLEVREVQLESGGTVWRLYAGPFAEQGFAAELCDALTARSTPCLVTVGSAAE
ncbi:MAG: SPOR domain-containing protein [Alphaproteobacteria bacterium]|nr:SPOR domain-containing protein [Alphaproteobacteria bacterium]